MAVMRRWSAALLIAIAAIAGGSGFTAVRGPAGRPHGVATILGGRATPRPDRVGPRFTTLDLRHAANLRLTDDLEGLDGNHLANLPRGESTLAGIRFHIGEAMVHLRGEGDEGEAGSAALPSKAEGIRVGTTFDRLHVLHATQFGEAEGTVEDGTEVGAYVVHYADRTSERIPIVYGVDLRDWWLDPEHPGQTRAPVAWAGTNPAAEEMGQSLRLFAMTWANPHPRKRVATIDVESRGTTCEPLVVAISLESE
jgi:hypothetical protein